MNNSKLARKRGGKKLTDLFRNPKIIEEKKGKEKREKKKLLLGNVSK